jgi:hypothetical protein
MKKLFSILVLSLAATPAVAAPDPDAWAAFARGDYAAAVEAGKRAGTADDLALAARALNAAADFDGGKRSARRTADEALDLADAAIKLDPTLVEGHLQAGVSLALKGARMAPMSAFMSGIAGMARARLDEALRLDPDYPLALSTSGAWRIEVTRRGGGALKGADPEKGYAELMAARAAAPDEITIAHEAALRLIADGRPEWRDEGLVALDAAIAASPKTKFDADIQALSLEFKLAIAAGRKAEKAFIARQP